MLMLPWLLAMAVALGGEILAVGAVIVVRFGNVIMRGSTAVLEFLMKSSGARYW